ncbi:enoyl-CoA hydratase [Marinobacterium nitratireducens]|uniref:Enoyl-CoA hydratase n=1 Tax=Marinobacterium nitratireducens TaxID=518897 RepID=A0A918DTF5_9GAMM|nr:enoyl-CoA hydratase-related protein [Marinobacterium nitratireducens]GGO83202.1 enoyl-CoA hydratase [Marinobacterium nitratireducens]
MQLPALEDASLTLQDGVATLRFDRDDVRNALTGTALVDDIIATLDWANRCNEARVLVLTGNGSAFSAGGNIHDMRARQGDFAGDVAELEERYRRGIQRLPLAMEKAEIPVIAAINGAAVGAGFDLACMCDLRIAADSVRMGETFLNLGIIPGDGGAWFLQRLVGYQRAAELTLTGRLIGAGEALDLGLLLEVTAADQLLPRSLELAARIATQPGRATRLTKRLLKSARRLELADFLDLCACYQGMCHQEEEHLAAVEAFFRNRT